jgi:hypothetical protein
MKRDPEISEILSTAKDLYSAMGADCVAKAVECYWHKRGHRQVRSERFELSPGTWGVRSNLVGGMPPRGKAVPAALGVFAL